jgi:hypothetical protein
MRIAVAALLLTFACGSASAHDKGCDGNSVPKTVKVNCCGKAEDHLLKPEQVTRGQNYEYIVSVDGLTFSISSSKALKPGRCSFVSSQCDLDHSGTRPIGLNHVEEDGPMLSVRYDGMWNDPVIDERTERPLIIAMFAAIAAWTIPVLIALA